MQVHYLHIMSNMERNTLQRTVKRFNNHTLIEPVSFSSLVCNDTEPDVVYENVLNPALPHADEVQNLTAT